jgi:hypothetical protein
MGEIIAAVSGLYGIYDKLHQNELNSTAAYQAKEAASTASTNLATKQAAAQESYQATIDRLNSQFEAGLAETDANGNPTDLGAAMKQISSNYMETSTTAIRQWAAERGIAGSTIEGQAVGNAATEASKQAQTYKANERAALFSQKEALAAKAKDLYNMNMTVPTAEYNLKAGDYKATANQSSIQADVAALTNNLKSLFPSTSTTSGDTVTGNTSTPATKKSVFEQEMTKSNNQDYTL